MLERNIKNGNFDDMLSEEKTVQKSRKKNNWIYMDFVCVDLPLVFIGIGICFLDKRLWWRNDVLSTMGSDS